MSDLPMARAALVAIVIAAVVGIGYTLRKVDVSLPFTASHYTVQVELEDAAGLDGADHPLATVAGTKQGRVVDVKVVGTKAVATLELEPDVEGKVFKDATAVVRPIGVIPVLSVNVDPGDPSLGALPSGGLIKAERTSTYVAPDKVLSVLDADTRAYLQVLVGQADIALDGRGSDLERAVREIAPMTASARRVAEAAADRQVLVRRLVGDIEEISGALARRRDQLARAVDSGGQVLHVTAARSPELAAAMRDLPETVEAAQRTLRRVKALSGPLNEAMDGALPALDELPAGLRELRALTPEARKLLADVEALERTGKTQLPAIREFTSRLGAAAVEGRPSVEAAAKTVDTLAQYGDGVAQLGDLISGAVSTSDINGVMARAIISAVEPAKPMNFGFDQVPEGASAPRARKAAAEDRKEMQEGLAKLLDARCATDKTACILRAVTPGLPGNEHLTRTRKGRR